ncbi:hypothetical protein F4680DRAFT_214603 [Xylaria scruposa]|nr:hypothetical protein F4680DRAFT_214603 [Xylaria scruposa]
MTITTILKLSAQPLPAGSKLEGTSVTIWLFGCLVATAAFDHLLFRRPRATWPEFKPLLFGTALLSFWYFLIVLDRWLHYGRARVVYGYIFVLPIIEILRIASTMYYLWGTYIVIWRELEVRFSDKQQGFWWFTARCAIFIVGLVSTYYVTLYIAQVGVWVQFLSLNTIADVATKRTGFEIAMTAFFFAFGLVTFAAACASLLWKARRLDGIIRRNRICLLLATLFLLIRSIFEFALTIRAWGPYSTRQSLQPIKDVGFGAITLIYLGLMYATAYTASSEHGQGSRDVRLEESDIRRAVLKRLEQDTDEGRLESPPFLNILDQIGSDLETIFREGPLSCNTGVSPLQKAQIARSYLQHLKKQYSTLNSREGNENGGRNTSNFLSSVLNQWRNFASRSNQGSGPDRRRSANQFVPENSRRTSSQSMRQATAPVIPVPPVSNGGPGAGMHAAASSFRHSTPSRWTAEVSEYTDRHLAP